MKFRKYVFSKPKPGKWPLQHLYLKINSECLARENPSEESSVSESSQLELLHEAINF